MISSERSFLPSTNPANDYADTQIVEWLESYGDLSPHPYLAVVRAQVFLDLEHKYCQNNPHETTPSELSSMKESLEGAKKGDPDGLKQDIYGFLMVFAAAARASGDELDQRRADAFLKITSLISQFQKSDIPTKTSLRDLVY